MANVCFPQTDMGTRTIGKNHYPELSYAPYANDT